MQKTVNRFFTAACLAAFLSACGPVQATDAGQPINDGGYTDATNPPTDGGPDTGTLEDSGPGRSCVWTDMYYYGVDEIGVEYPPTQDGMLRTPVRRPGSEDCAVCTCDPVGGHAPETCAASPDLCTGPTGSNTCEVDGTTNCGYNLPPEIPYSADDFTCLRRIDYDTWVQAGHTGEEETSVNIINGQIVATFSFSGPMLKPSRGSGYLQWTCGPMNRCWLNWGNPDSTQGRCWVRFWETAALDTPGCLDAMNPPEYLAATIDCFPPGTSLTDAEAGVGMQRSEIAAWVRDG